VRCEAVVAPGEGSDAAGAYRRVQNSDLQIDGTPDDTTGLTGTISENASIGMFPAVPITTVSSRFPNA
jgi:hypothetical protein